MKMPKTSRRLFLASGSATAVFGALATAAVAENHPDGELLALGREFDTAHARWNSLGDVPGDIPDEVISAAAKACGDVADKIIELRATTLDGLKVKARALSWCHGDEFEGIAETIIPNVRIVGNDFVKDRPSTDRLVADSILFDLIAMAGLEARA